MIYVSKADERHRINQGKFIIRLISPGLKLNIPGDRGLGPLGRVDHSTIEPGGLIPMHPHQNDEILSYMRGGTMLHRDSHGLSEALHGTHMMMMNAGSGLFHEEGVAETDEQRVDMLQMFFRPREANLEPSIQFRTFPSRHSLNKWRLIGGPENSEAPLKIRSEAFVYDAHLSDATLETPELNNLTSFLYVFDGSVALAGKDIVLNRGDAALIKDERVMVSARGAADLVLFIVDETAKYSRSGAYSG
jgi:redox-sensitive bicupin YhaK (pirin superfamily)